MFNNSVDDKERRKYYDICIFALDQYIWNMIHSRKKEIADFLYTQNCLLNKLEDILSLFTARINRTAR